MALVTSYGIFDRAAVVERAKAIMGKRGVSWGVAMKLAYVEARAERDSVSTADIEARRRIRSLAREADRLAALEDAN